MSMKTTVLRGLACGAVATAVGIATPGPAATASPRASSTTIGGPAGRPGAPVRAQLVARVSPPYPGTDHTTIEGPAFGRDGKLYMVNASAPAGRPKVLRLDVRTTRVEAVYTNATSAYSSLQFGPRDGRMYLTDLTGGRIESFRTDGADRRTVLAGRVAGQPMAPDDLAFDPDGNMYVTDMVGTPWKPTGRVLRLGRGARRATVLASGMPSPNGITFDPTFSALWISQYTGNRVDHLELSPDRRRVLDGHTAFRFDVGTAQVDSTAIDGSGNVYQCVHGTGTVEILGTTGARRATVVIPQRAGRRRTIVSNLAIEPGTTDGYVTVGGDDGGYVYRFRALAKGIAQSNGGGA